MQATPEIAELLRKLASTETSRLYSQRKTLNEAADEIDRLNAALAASPPTAVEPVAVPDGGLTADELCKTPYIEELTFRNYEWEACETVQDCYNLMRQKIRHAFQRFPPPASTDLREENGDTSLWRFWNDKARNLQYALTKSEARAATLSAENTALKERLEWKPISTCPFRDAVDLWCIYGGEEYAQYDGGASIGKLVSNRNKSEEYGFFGNQSNDGVPQGHAPDLVPVAWRPAVQSCPAELIADVMNIPLTLEAALAREGK